MKKTIEGESTEVSILQDGDYFGEISLVKNIPRTATIVTKTPALLLTLHQEQFLSLIKSDQNILKIIYNEIDKRI